MLGASGVSHAPSSTHMAVQRSMQGQARAGCAASAAGGRLAGECAGTAGCMLGASGVAHAPSSTLTWHCSGSDETEHCSMPQAQQKDGMLAATLAQPASHASQPCRTRRDKMRELHEVPNQAGQAGTDLHVLLSDRAVSQAQQKDGRLATALAQQAGHLADANRIRHEMSDSHVHKFREETRHRCACWARCSAWAPSTALAAGQPTARPAGACYWCLQGRPQEVGNLLTGHGGAQHSTLCQAATGCLQQLPALPGWCRRCRLHCRTRVLQRLGHLGKDNVVTVKVHMLPAAQSPAWQPARRVRSASACPCCRRLCHSRAWALR